MNTETAAHLDLRHLVMNTPEPILVKGVLDWELLQWDVNKWAEVLGEEVLQFRCGKNYYTKEPQYENKTDTVSMTFKEFVNYQKSNSHEWLYFDYKYLREWLTNIRELQMISWKSFGFPEMGVEDSTIWIGSKGAHTPCHIDTYGCNVIAQIYGRKRWILFPPDENLKATRVPYEESSIFSNINLFTPSCNDFKGTYHSRSIVLDPGDVLILPHRWWHYVENLELAVSVNTWIELPNDSEERLGEAIVQTLILHLAKQLPQEQQHYLLNPAYHQQAFTSDEKVLDSIKLSLACLQHYKTIKPITSSLATTSKIQEILQKYQNIQIVQKLSDNTFQMLIELQRNRFGVTQITETTNTEQENQNLKKFFDALVDKDVIDTIKEKLLKD